METKSHIIAEAGVNHNGRLDYGRRLIDIAKKSGADSVKFQIINPYGLYLNDSYEYGHYDIKEVLKMRFETVLSDEEYTALHKYCQESNIEFSASVFDEKGLDLLASFQPSYIKIASCDLNNIRFLRRVAERNIKMIISTGMSTLKEVEYSLNELGKVGFSDIVLLHCVSIYPAEVSDTNLSFIQTLQNEFGLPVGFSDHTRTAHAAIAAYAMGARWFEKHFTFDNSLKGFDHKHAQNEEEFIDYIAQIRSVEEAFSLQKKKVSSGEAYTKRRARRSLYANENLKVGRVIEDEDVLCLRPENKMNANDLDKIIGKPLKKDISKNEPFTWGHF